MISATVISESGIRGEAGFVLGDVFNPDSPGVERLSRQDKSVYRVTPGDTANSADYLLLRITADKRIHRISIFSRKMSAVQCSDERFKRRKAIEEKYPELAYYAMTESEMFYNDSRTLTIECVRSDGEIRLKTEYADDVLAGQ